MERLEERAALLDIPEEITSGAGFFLFYTDEIITCDWVSDNEAVIDVWFMGGEAQMYQMNIHRPERVDVTVTLTATLRYLEFTKVVVFPILVKAEHTAASLIEEDMETVLMGSLVELTEMTLPQLGQNGSSITWELEASPYATLTAFRLILGYLGSNYSITLIGTFQLDETILTKRYDLTVSADPSSPMERLEERAALLDVPTEITSGAGFFLFYTDEFITCDWESDNEAVIDVMFIGGEAQIYQTFIQRPQRVDATVTLTATLHYYSFTKIVAFSILVKAEHTESSLIEEDMETLHLDPMVEMSHLFLPNHGDRNGSLITWELEATPYASLSEYELTLGCHGGAFQIVLIGTFQIDETIQTKRFDLTVSSADYSTIEELLSTPIADIHVKATVYFFYSRGFFVFDDTGLLSVVAYDDWSDQIHLGDEIVLTGDMVNGYIGFELFEPQLETILSLGNEIDVATHEYVYGVSFPRPCEIWTITGEIKIVNSIVYLYSGQVYIAIIELSTINDSYNALKAHVGQIVTIQTVNYYFYTNCYGFLYQGGEAGIRVGG